MKIKTVENINSIRFNALFKSEEYREELLKLSKEIIKNSEKAENEATVSGCFENSISYFIRSFFGKEIEFTKEKNLGDSVRHIFSNKRMDAVYNNLIIEYKHSSKLRNDKDVSSAEEQTINYLNQHLKEGIEYEAILTDGIKIKFIAVSDKKIISSDFSKISPNNLDRIIKNLLFLDKKKMIGSNIANDFIIEAPNNLSKRLSNILFDSIKNERMNEKTNMLFVEWKELFHLSEADKGRNQDIDKRRKELGGIFQSEIIDNETEYEALFSLQTTYAIIVKLVAFKVLVQVTQRDDGVLDNLKSSNSIDLKKFFQLLEDGSSFKNNGIRNLLEGDFFAWYCDDNQWNQSTSEIIKEIIDILLSYEDLKFTNSYEPQDLFKDLYIGTIPKSIRHSFGEYFTPSWLADSVVNNSIELIKNNKWRGIDPTCGSGVFLIRMIKKIIGDLNVEALNKNEKFTLLSEILGRVNGVDLNPLSVLTCRVNYFISISKLIDYDNEIEIPVYLGDSANLPTITKIDDIDCYKYSITNIKQPINIILPVSFVKHKDFFNTMFSLQTLVKVEKANDIYERILGRIPDKERTESIKKEVKTLAENLVFLHTNKWDGIWVRIIQNFLSTVKLGTFDIIVGNPPWVKWEFLPQQYSKKIKELCIDKHLFSGSVRTGGISLNICALIANTTASQWLKKDGILAFLMPKTLMTSQSYEGFRNFYLDFEKKTRLYIQKIDDWSDSGHPFVTVQEKFLTYYLGALKVDYTKGFPVKKFIKKKNTNIVEINNNKSFASVSDYFTILDDKAVQLTKNRTGFTFIEHNSKYDFSVIIGKNFYKARSGAEFTPGEVYFLKDGGNAKTNKTHLFKNYALKTAKHKVIQNNKLELETQFIYPLIKGPSVNAYSCETNKDFAVFPYKWNNQKPVTFGVLHDENKKLSEYLLDNKNLIEQQSERSRKLSIGKEFYSLSKIGEYTFVDCLVAFRDNTTMSACVVTPVETPWGEKKMPICAKHAPFISMTKDKRKITLDEAFYICGILNTNIVKEYISKSNDSRSFSIDLQIKIPEFMPNNKDFETMSKLSKEVHNKVSRNEDVNLILEKIEKIYIKICSEY